MNHLEKTILIERLEDIMNSTQKVMDQSYIESIYPKSTVILHENERYNVSIKPSSISIGGFKSVPDVGFEFYFSVTNHLTLENENSTSKLYFNDVKSKYQFIINVFSNITRPNFQTYELSEQLKNSQLTRGLQNEITRRFYIFNEIFASNFIANELSKVNQLYNKYVSDFIENNRYFKIENDSQQLMALIEHVNDNIDSSVKEQMISNQIFKHVQIRTITDDVLSNINDYYKEFVDTPEFEDLVKDVLDDNDIVEIDNKLKNFMLHRFFNQRFDQLIHENIAVEDSTLYHMLLPEYDAKFKTQFHKYALDENLIRELRAKIIDFDDWKLERDLKNVMLEHYQKWIISYLNTDLANNLDIRLFINEEEIYTNKNPHSLILTLIEDDFNSEFIKYINDYVEFSKTEIDKHVFD